MGCLWCSAHPAAHLGNFARDDHAFSRVFVEGGPEGGGILLAGSSRPWHERGKEAEGCLGMGRDPTALPMPPCNREIHFRNMQGCHDETRLDTHLLEAGLAAGRQYSV